MKKHIALLLLVFLLLTACANSGGEASVTDVSAPTESLSLNPTAVPTATPYVNEVRTDWLPFGVKLEQDDYVESIMNYRFESVKARKTFNRKEYKSDEAFYEALVQHEQQIFAEFQSRIDSIEALYLKSCESEYSISPNCAAYYGIFADEELLSQWKALLKTATLEPNPEYDYKEHLDHYYMESWPPSMYCIDYDGVITEVIESGLTLGGLTSAHIPIHIIKFKTPEDEKRADEIDDIIWGRLTDRYKEVRNGAGAYPFIID